MERVGGQTHPFMYGNTYKLLGRSFVPKIVLIVAVASFAPLLLVSGLVLHQFGQSHEEKLYAHLIEMVHRHAQDIDDFLDERINNLQFLSDTCGMETLPDEPFLQEKLYQLQRAYGGVFEDLGIVNAQGRQVHYAGRFNLANAQYADAQWFNKALENQYFISDVFTGLRSSPHFIMSVKHSYQDRVYLLKATINFEAFNVLAENLRIGKTGFAFILNEESQFQTKPHYDMLPRKKSYQAFLHAGRPAKHGTYIGTLRDALQGEETIYVAALLKDKDWMLVFQQDKSEAFKEFIHARITAVVVIFLGALLIVVANIVLIHKVLGRIAKADQEKEMMNRQVIEAGKLASVGELAAGIAHEVNNPVAIMVQEAGWMADLLEEEDLQQSRNMEEFTRALKQIDIQGHRCKEITHKLLSFARKTSPEIEKVQINEVIEEVVAITDIAAYTNIAMDTDLDQDLPPISGSQTEIQQVILNLINNSLYALEKNGGTIRISSQLEGEYVLLTVEDDGPGIPEANLERIFDPFFTTKPVGKGSGLGLSICFGIVKRMGGKIDVDSQIDKGTRFEIRFPLESRAAAERQDTAALTVQASKTAKQNGYVFQKPLNLLLVDDEEGFVKVLSKRLAKRNIQVTKALSGVEGIQALRKFDFEVAILDLKMEDMDGLEVLKIFKKMYPQMKIVILSGHESEKAARDGIKFGAAAYLSKPCKFEELIDTIRQSVAQ